MHPFAGAAVDAAEIKPSEAWSRVLRLLTTQARDRFHQISNSNPTILSAFVRSSFLCRDLDPVAYLGVGKALPVVVVGPSTLPDYILPHSSPRSTIFLAISDFLCVGPAEPVESMQLNRVVDAIW